MAWIRCCGGAPNGGGFPWDAYTDGTWSTKSVSLQSQWGYMTCTTLSPTIKNGCKIQGSVNSQNQNDTVQVEVSTDLATWTNVGTVAAGASPRVFAFDISAYAGSKIYIRMSCYAGGQTVHTITLTSCSVVI